MTIAWKEPKFGKKEKELVDEVLDSGYVSEGPMTKKLEQELAHIIGVKHVVMTTSCTAALWLAIEADKRIKNYTSGEVIIPSLTFVGTKNAVEMSGLTYKIHDVSKENFCLESNKYVGEADIIIPVNLLGRSSGNFNYPDSTIICDNAGALGSDVPNGKVGCYSLQGNKIISCGQGGFCATDDDEYAKEIRKIKDYGREDKMENDSTGFNLKFNDILAAVTLGQLEQLEERKKELINQYKIYSKELKNYGKFMEFKLTEVPLWIEFFCKDRDRLFEALNNYGICCRKPWKPFEPTQNAKYYYENCLWLPNGPTLSGCDLMHIIKIIKEFYDEDKRNT